MWFPLHKEILLKEMPPKQAVACSHRTSLNPVSIATAPWAVLVGRVTPCATREMMGGGQGTARPTKSNRPHCRSPASLL